MRNIQMLSDVMDLLIQGEISMLQLIYNKPDITRSRMAAGVEHWQLSLIHISEPTRPY